MRKNSSVACGIVLFAGLVLSAAPAGASAKVSFCGTAKVGPGRCVLVKASMVDAKDVTFMMLRSKPVHDGEMVGGSGMAGGITKCEGGVPLVGVTYHHVAVCALGTMKHD